MLSFIVSKDSFHPGHLEVWYLDLVADSPRPLLVEIQASTKLADGRLVQAALCLQDIGL